MTTKTRALFKSDKDTSLADNTSGAITAVTLRGEMDNIADSALFPADIAATAGLSVFARPAAGAGAYSELVSASDTALRNTAGVLAFGKITNAILSTIGTGILKGRASAGAGVVEDLTAAQVTALLNAFTSTLQGLVPASGGGTANFLRADGTWAAPAGGGADAHDVQIAVKNATGASLAAALPVALGSDSGTTTPNVVPAVGTGAMPCAGLLVAAIANGATGAAIRSGLVTGLNTSAYAFGAPLYIAAAGGLTATRPTTGQIQIVAYVTRVHATTGEIFVALGPVGQLISSLTLLSAITGSEYIPVSGDQAITTAQLIGAARAVNYIAETTTARSFTSGDHGALIGATNAGATVFTIPANATTALPVGFSVVLARDTAATVTLTAAAGVVLNGITAGSTTITTTNRGEILLHKIAADTWRVRGDCAAVA